MYCPACGERQITRSRFCSSCGLALNKVHTILDEIEIKQPAATPAVDTVSFSVPTPIEEVERQMIILTLKKTGGNKTHAAELLGMSLKTLHNKLNSYRGKTSEG